MKVLLTGGTGFFGSCLRKHFDKEGIDYINFDLVRCPEDEAGGRFFQGDLSQKGDIERCFSQHGPFDNVCHLAAQLAHDVKSPDYLWKTNADGTNFLSQISAENGVRRFIFTSTNCLWGHPVGHPVREDEPTNPVEIYGRSKLEAEKRLSAHRDRMNVIIFRSPTIMGAGRVGLMSILFDFIIENKLIPVVGNGKNPYQFIAADDYSDAIIKALGYNKTATFNIGSDNPVSLEQSYRYVIEKSGSKSKCYHLPTFLVVPALKVLHKLGLSPLGPYQYNMIAEEFVFDTTLLKTTLGWKPEISSQEAFFEAFDFYRRNASILESEHDHLPAHRRKASAGILKALKWIS